MTVVEHVLPIEMCQAFIEANKNMGFARPLSLLGMMAQQVAQTDEDCKDTADNPLKTACSSATTKCGDEGIFKSLFTFAVYLNASFQGGCLNFVKLNVCPEKRYESLATVVPASGRFAIFRHEELHEGGGVREGIKYMVQCDVLYERVGDLPKEGADGKKN